MGMLDRFRRHRQPAERPPDNDWDGGWRGVRPITPTLSGTDARVSPGLPFRDSLATWQDIAFGSSLGHSVSPAAPVGTMHGVVRYRTPGAWMVPAGGELPLRSVSDAGVHGPATPTTLTPTTPARPGSMATKASTVPKKPVIAGGTSKSVARISKPATPGGPAASAATLGQAPPLAGTALPDNPVVSGDALVPGDHVPPGDTGTPNLVLRQGAPSGFGMPGGPTGRQNSSVTPGGTSTPGNTPNPPSRAAPSSRQPSSPGGKAAVRPHALGRPLIVAQRIASLPVRTLSVIKSTVESKHAVLPVVQRAPQPRPGALNTSVTNNPAGEPVPGDQPRPLVGDGPPPPLPSTHQAIVDRSRSSTGQPTVGGQSQPATTRPLVSDSPMSPAIGGGSDDTVRPRTTPAVQREVSAPAAKLDDPLPTKQHATDGRFNFPDTRSFYGKSTTLLAGQQTTAPVEDPPRRQHRRVTTGIGEPMPSIPNTAVLPATAPGTPPPPANRAMSTPSVQRTPATPKPPRHPVTVVARSVNAGAALAPAPPEYRSLPLLASRPPLVNPAPTSTMDDQPAVPRAMWRRDPDHVRPTAQQVGQPAVQRDTGHVVDVVAMAPRSTASGPARPSTPTARAQSPMPVASVQRSTPATSPPAAASGSGSGSPAVFSQPVPTNTVRVNNTAPPPTRTQTTQPAQPARPAGREVDELARRLVEPVSRLLRADIRHGRERAGRAHDRWR